MEFYLFTFYLFIYLFFKGLKQCWLPASRKKIKNTRKVKQSAFLLLLLLFNLTEQDNTTFRWNPLLQSHEQYKSKKLPVIGFFQKAVCTRLACPRQSCAHFLLEEPNRQRAHILVEEPNGQQQSYLFVFVWFLALKKRIPSEIGKLSCFVWLKSVLFNLLCVSGKSIIYRLRIIRCDPHSGSKNRDVCPESQLANGQRWSSYETGFVATFL